MDKRVLLAMVLFFLVWIVSSMIFGPGPRRQQPQSGAPDTSAAVQQAPPPVVEPPEEVEARRTFEDESALTLENQLTATGGGEIVVEGSNYRCALSPRGAMVTSFILEDYTDAEGEPADLVRDSGTGALGLTLETADGVLDLRKTDFAVREERRGEWRQVRFDAQDAGGLRVTKTFEFHPDTLPFRFSLRVRGVPNEDGAARYAIHWGDGIPVLEVKPEYDRAGMASIAMLGNNLVKDGGGGRGMGFGCGGASKKDEWKTETHNGMVRWAGVRSKYFLGAVIPHREIEGEVLTQRNPGKFIMRTAFKAPVSLDGEVSEDYRVYLGPMIYEEMSQLGVGLERAVDLGMKPIVPVSKAVLWAMTTLYKVIPNYGVVILILSVLTKVIFYPLTKKSLQSMKKMQEIKPEVDKINQKFKDNPQRRQQETMKLYKNKKINPMGGCLPILVQMPIFIALYSVLYNVIEMRKAPFTLWMKDLSIPDNVGYLFGIPLNPLPLIMTGTMILQQRLTPTDPRQAMFATVMPIMFLFLFYGLPSGLVFYWTVNNVVSIIQQIWMKRGDQPVSSGKTAQRRDYALASRR
jgi:YidC/Oxa1 family membrane protein insertase